MRLSSSSRSRSRSFEVFLSFRGKDTRNNFVSHLYAELYRSRIDTFIDEEGIRRGSDIRPTLLKIIEESRIAVIVFSKNYAESRWCLDELLKIMNCHKDNGLIVYPVFYGVDPSDVRNQTGVFGEAFSRHTDKEKIHLWRGALENVGCKAGWDLNNPIASHEASCIKNILEEIICDLDYVTHSIHENLIGVDRRLQNVMPLNLGELDVGMIGILGMAGSGKTTIARAVFDDMYDKFEGHSFVHDISEVSKNHGLAFLQNQILSSVLPHKNVEVRDKYDGCQKIKGWLSRIKVLIVLDKVDSIEQLEALAGARNWFGKGSRILITTTDERLLVAHKLVDSNSMYNVILLDDEEAIKLLNNCAFQNGIPTEAHKESLKRVIRYADGHPGALKCLGSKLIGKPIDQWENTIDSLKTCPEAEIDNMLKVSLKGLNILETELFLDIACFFNGWIKNEVIDILDSCGLFATSGLGTLREKSLVTFSNESIRMHNLIQEMGRHIVRQEHPDEPSRQSRLWHPEEVKDVLMEDKGTKDTKAIVIRNLHKLDARGTFNAFTRMKKLRLLHANTQMEVTCDAVQWIIEGPGNLKYVPCHLKWLTWDYFNLNSWPQDLHAKNLAGLQMRHSSIVNLCIRRDTKFLEKLKFLDLSFSEDLTRTPDFGYLPHLKKLNLEFCSSLVQVHPSIGVHNSLVQLNLRYCEKLESLPSRLEMRSLEVLNLSGCSKLTKIPDFVSMYNLLELDLSHNLIQQLPSTIGDLPRLVSLDIVNCRNLTSIPHSIIMLNIKISSYGCPI